MLSDASLDFTKPVWSQLISDFICGSNLEANIRAKILISALRIDSGL